jgi:hypothetical protein
MLIKALARSLYGLFGAGFLVAGASALLLDTGLLPEAIRKVLVDVAQGNFNTLHIMQEFGSLLVFAGLITFWFMYYYDQSRAFHWAMTTFWGLIALIHWVDVRGSVESVVGPLITTIPLALFVVVGLLRLGLERRATAGCP